MYMCYTMKLTVLNEREIFFIYLKSSWNFLIVYRVVYRNVTSKAQNIRGHRYLANDQEYPVKFWISFPCTHNTRCSWIRDETFSMPDYDVGHGRVNSSPEEKGLPRDTAVSDILPGIVAQVKRQVGSPFLYYSRWITRPLSHSLQFKYNEPHTDTFLLILFPGLRTHPHLPTPIFRLLLSPNVM